MILDGNIELNILEKIVQEGKEEFEDTVHYLIKKYKEVVCEKSI